MTSTQRDLEARWLRYAIDVVCSTDHDAACQSAGGGTLEPGAVHRFRWPGYIGENVAAGGVLFIGNVHRDFTSNGVPATVSQLLVSTTRALLEDPEGHGPQYLQDTRNAYVRGLSGGGQPGSWTVARPFDYILRKAGVGWDRVVYTNSSKSQQTPGANIQRLTKGCLDRWPLDELADQVGVKVIVAGAAPAKTWLARRSRAHLAFPQQGWSYALLDSIAEAVRTALHPGS